MNTISTAASDGSSPAAAKPDSTIVARRRSVLPRPSAQWTKAGAPTATDRCLPPARARRPRPPTPPGASQVPARASRETPGGRESGVAGSSSRCRHHRLAPAQQASAFRGTLVHEQRASLEKVRDRHRVLSILAHENRVRDERCAVVARWRRVGGLEDRFGGQRESCRPNDTMMSGRSFRSSRCQSDCGRSALSDLRRREPWRSLLPSMSMASRRREVRDAPAATTTMRERRRACGFTRTPATVLAVGTPFRETSWRKVSSR